MKTKFSLIVTTVICSLYPGQKYSH